MTAFARSQRPLFATARLRSADRSSLLKKFVCQRKEIEIYKQELCDEVCKRRTYATGDWRVMAGKHQRHYLRVICIKIVDFSIGTNDLPRSNTRQLTVGMIYLTPLPANVTVRAY